MYIFRKEVEKIMKKLLKVGVVLSISVVIVFSSVAIAANTKQSSKIVKGENKIISNIKNFELEKQFTKDRNIIFEDDFESYENFTLDFPPWTQYDGDGATTYGSTDYDFPNEYYTGSYILFNPSLCTPPMTDAPPHSGEKFAACFNAYLPAINDDWLFSPQLSSTDFDKVSFWARAYTDKYNLDRFEVGISTTDTNSSNFTIISDLPYIEATINWTEYVYNISSYSGDIYIAIHCVSNDSFILMIDDFKVTEKECEPNIDVEKYVRDPNYQEWIDADTKDEALDLPICEDVTFKIVIHNNGDCPISEINVYDTMHDSLKYISANPEPDNFEYNPPYYNMDWNFTGPLYPCEIIEIYINAHVEGPEDSYDSNYVMTDGECIHGNYVADEDYAWIHAYKKSKNLNTPFIKWLQFHHNLFPIIRQLLGI
jgi:hypothetical protein